jgi:hypothetical protein
MREKMRSVAGWLVCFLFLHASAWGCITLNNPFASSVGESSVTVGWSSTCPVAGMTYAYSIFLLFENQSQPTWVQGGSGQWTTSLTYHTLGPNTRLRFVLWARPAGASSATPQVEGTVSTLARAPAVVSPAFDRLDSRGFRIQWQNQGAYQTQVDLSTSADFSTMERSVLVRGAEWTAACLDPGTTYHARVRGLNWDGVPTAYVLLGSTRTPEVGPPTTHFTWESGRWQATLAPETLGPTQTLLFSANPLTDPLRVGGWTSSVEAANRKRLDAGFDSDRGAVPGGLAEVWARDSCPDRMDDRISRPADLTFQFTASDGWVSTVSSRVRAETLRFFRLDAANNIWVKTPASRVDPARGIVSASVSTLGVYAVMGEPDASLKDAFAFPNPYRRSRGGGMTFTNLSEQATLRIFTPWGKLVRTLTETDGDGQLHWDVANGDGEALAPGVYSGLIESPSDRRFLKIIVQP